MKHDYSSYSIAAPIIKSASALEDALGSIMTTSTLLAVAFESTEEIESTLNHMKKDKAAIGYAEHVDRALRPLDAILTTASERLKDDIILLAAVAEHRGETASASYVAACVGGAQGILDWSTACTKARAAIDAECAAGLTEEQVSKLADITLDAVREAMAVRAPNVRAVLDKMALIDRTNMQNDPDTWDAIRADIRAIAVA